MRCRYSCGCFWYSRALNMLLRCWPRLTPQAAGRTGWTTTAHAMAGADVTISPHVGLTGELRYGYAKGKMGQDFQGFDRIDLSGATATAGLFFRF